MWSNDEASTIRAFLLSETGKSKSEENTPEGNFSFKKSNVSFDLDCWFNKFVLSNEHKL